MTANNVKGASSTFMIHAEVIVVLHFNATNFREEAIVVLEFDATQTPIALIIQKEGCMCTLVDQTQQFPGKPLIL